MLGRRKWIRVCRFIEIGKRGSLLSDFGNRQRDFRSLCYNQIYNMPQVFLSYSRKDLAFVEQLAADLKGAGLDVWYDVSGLAGGDRWSWTIEDAIRNSQYVVVVLSPDSIKAEWVEKEFLFASSLKMKIVPLMYRDCSLRLSYANLQYIEVQNGKYKQNFNRIRAY